MGATHVITSKCIASKHGRLLDLQMSLLLRWMVASVLVTSAATWGIIAKSLYPALLGARRQHGLPVLQLGQVEVSGMAPTGS